MVKVSVAKSGKMSKHDGRPSLSDYQGKKLLSTDSGTEWIIFDEDILWKMDDYQ